MGRPVEPRLTPYLRALLEGARIAQGSGFQRLRWSMSLAALRISAGSEAGEECPVGYSGVEECSAARTCSPRALSRDRSSLLTAAVLASSNALASAAMGVGARNPVVAGQGACLYSLMGSSQGGVRTSRRGDGW